MESGRIIEQGTVFDVFADPQHAGHPPVRRDVLRDRPVGSRAGDACARGTPAGSSPLAFATSSDPARCFGGSPEHGVRFEIVYGGIKEIQGRSRSAA